MAQSVEKRLRKDGYKTVAVTLPGRAGNPRSASGSVTNMLLSIHVIAYGRRNVNLPEPNIL